MHSPLEYIPELRAQKNGGVGDGGTSRGENVTGWSSRLKLCENGNVWLQDIGTVLKWLIFKEAMCAAGNFQSIHMLYFEYKRPFPLVKNREVGDHCVTSAQTAAANWWRIVFSVSGSRFRYSKFNMADLQLICSDLEGSSMK